MSISFIIPAQTLIAVKLLITLSLFTHVVKNGLAQNSEFFRQQQFFHVGINIILRTHRTNTRDGFFCNKMYHTG
jgi:hypothetical protein